MMSLATRALVLGSLALSQAGVFAARQKVEQVSAAQDSVDEHVEAGKVADANVPLPEDPGSFPPETPAPLVVNNAPSPAAQGTGDSGDEAHRHCTEELKKYQTAASVAQDRLTSAKASEEEACQRVQDNKDFFWPFGPSRNFECDHGIEGDCQAKLLAYKESVMQKLKIVVRSGVQQDQEQYRNFVATCEKLKQQRIDEEGAKAVDDQMLADKMKECKEDFIQQRNLMYGLTAAGTVVIVGGVLFMRQPADS